MKALLLLLAVSACATVPEGVHIAVSDEKATQCLAAGGCGLMPLAQLREMLQKAHDEGVAEAAEGLDTQGCRRGAT
jgi:hypothetical protein